MFLINRNQHRSSSSNELGVSVKSSPPYNKVGRHACHQNLRILTGLLCDDQKLAGLSILPFFVFYQCYLEHWRRRSPYSFFTTPRFLYSWSSSTDSSPIAIHVHSCSHNEQVYIHQK